MVNFFQFADQFVVFGIFFHQQLGISQNWGQEIVHVVHDGRRQETDRFKFVFLQYPFFQLMPFVFEFLFFDEALAFFVGLIFLVVTPDQQDKNEDDGRNQQ